MKGIEESTNKTKSRKRKVVLATAMAALVAGFGSLAAVSFADANSASSTGFTDTFEDGDTAGWSRSGGTWSVVTDGSKVLQQSNAASDNARLFAGDGGWSDYTVRARVKPSTLGARGYVGLLARATGSTTFYRLALLPGNVVQLQAVNSGAVTVLGSASRPVSAGTWYTLSLTVNGGQISGSMDGAAVAAAANTMAGKGRVGVQTSYSTASFDDVTVTVGGATPAPTTTTASPAPSASPTRTAAPSSTPSPASTSKPPATAGALYVSPTGKDSAAGTQSDPTALTSAITRVAAGGTIYLRGGTYKPAQTVTIAPGNNGTSSARKKLSAYPGETPVLNFSAQGEDPANRGIAVNGSFWHVYGVVVERAGDNGIFVGGSNNIIERTVTRFNRDSGVQLSRIASDTPRDKWPANNLVLSAESHDNADSDGEDADGFAAKLTVGPGNVFRYAVAHHNIDDGWDLFAKPDTGPIDPVTIEDSLAYDNGTLTDGTVNANGDRNGYKLGGSDIPVDHVVRRSIAYRNGKHGFTYNSNPGTIAVSTNLSVDNAQRNYSFDAGTSVFRDNASCRGGSGTNDRIVGNADGSNQFWSGSNGSRCSSSTGALDWSFAADGRLVVTFGGRAFKP